MSVTIKDNGYQKLIAAIDASGKFEITVGVHKEEGGAIEEGGALSVAEIAEINEFGLGVPARPAITGWADEDRDKCRATMAAEVEAALKARISPAQRLDQVAQHWAGEVQQRIANGVPPPNAPSTIARKGSATPLIDKGQFRASIRGKVAKGK